MLTKTLGYYFEESNPRTREKRILATAKPDQHLPSLQKLAGILRAQLRDVSLIEVSAKKL